jgi:hypothetical protein
MALKGCRSHKRGILNGLFRACSTALAPLFSPYQTSSTSISVLFRSNLMRPIRREVSVRGADITTPTPAVRNKMVRKAGRSGSLLLMPRNVKRSESVGSEACFVFLTICNNILFLGESKNGDWDGAIKICCVGEHPALLANTNFVGQQIDLLVKPILGE